MLCGKQNVLLFLSSFILVLQSLPVPKPSLKEAGNGPMVTAVYLLVRQTVFNCVISTMQAQHAEKQFVLTCSCAPIMNVIAAVLRYTPDLQWLVMHSQRSEVISDLTHRLLAENKFVCAL